MRMFASLALVVCTAAFGQQLTPVPPPSTDLPGRPFSITKTWVIGGEGDWDYLTMDPTARQLFIAHGPTVQVVDVETGAVAGTIKGIREAHQVLLDGDGGYGYVSDGQADMVRVFDRNSFQLIANIPTGPSPRSMALDSASGLLFVIGAPPSAAGGGGIRTATQQRSESASRGTPTGPQSTVTVIDVGKRIPLAQVIVPGALGFARGDGNGRVYVTVRDRNQIMRINAAQINAAIERAIDDGAGSDKNQSAQSALRHGNDQSVRLDFTGDISPALRDAIPHSFPLDSSCQDPRSLAIDRAHERLFVACSNFRMVVLNPGTGQTVAALPIGPGPDAIAYDGNRGLIFTANGGGDGSLTIIRQDVTDTYNVVQTLPTRQHARTLAIDASTGAVYLTSVQYGAQMSTPFTNGSPAPLKVAPIDNSFQVIVVGN
jgi:DNA-binding beta-propeller fold protein YncE